MIEKPEPSDAPTNLATPGRYVFSNRIFECLKEIPRGKGGEYQLTDAINLLAKKEDVFAHVFEGDRFDTGNIPSYLDATIEFALRNESTKKIMEDILVEKVQKYGLSKN
jgi:UTP--glucose-1-phosphate uridylyltransferase